MQVPERWRQPLRLRPPPAASLSTSAAPAAGADGGGAGGEADGSFAGMLAALLAQRAAAADAKDMSALLAPCCLLLCGLWHNAKLRRTGIRLLLLAGPLRGGVCFEHICETHETSKLWGFNVRHDPLCAKRPNSMPCVRAGQLASIEWWVRRGAHVPALPPEVVLQARHSASLARLPGRVLREAGTVLKSTRSNASRAKRTWCCCSALATAELVLAGCAARPVPGAAAAGRVLHRLPQRRDASRCASALPSCRSSSMPPARCCRSTQWSTHPPILYTSCQPAGI